VSNNELIRIVVSINSPEELRHDMIMHVAAQKAVWVQQQDTDGRVAGGGAFDELCFKLTTLIAFNEYRLRHGEANVGLGGVCVA
jgi:hypothetical protein